MAWTDDRVMTLRKLWGAGNSASQIAAELGGVTRNAVIGKVHRLGLSGRDRTGTGAAAQAAQAKMKARPATRARATSSATANPAAKPKSTRAPVTPRKPAHASARTTTKPATRPASKPVVNTKPNPASKPKLEPVSRARNVPSAPRIPQALQDMANRPFQAPSEAVKIADGSYANVLTITESMCKFPIGDPGADDFRFCARRTEPEEPYCTAHSRIAYQPSRRRSSNKANLPPVLRRKAIR